MSSAPQPGMTTRPGRVLLAAGDKISLVHMRALLSKSGYDVLAVEDGTEALRLLESSAAPGLVVLDWIMPGISGLDICRRLTDARKRRQRYVILLTAWNQRDDRVVGLEAGADDCLYKPVDVRELRIRLQIGAQIILERALRESEERFHSAFEYAGAGMALIDSAGQFLQANQALRDFFGYSAPEMQSTDLRKLAHPDDQPPFAALLHDFLEKHRRKAEFERKFVTRDGSTAWAAITLSAVLDAENHPVHLVLQVQNITKRKLAEQALQRNEAFLRAITDNISDLIFVIDGQQKWRYVSPSHRESLGYSSHELLGQSALSYVHPEDVPVVTQFTSDLALGEHTSVLPLRMLHQDGRWRHFEGRASMLHSTNGRIEGTLFVARPIDDRILAEQKLQAAHAETELFLDFIPSMVIGLDGTGKITRWNRTAANVLGLHRKQTIGRDILQCGLRWLHAEMAQEIKRWLATTGSYRADDLAYERDGKMRFLGLTVRRMPSAEGEAAGFVVTGADVTERKLLEDQLRQAQKMEAIGQLAAGIAHEINTPTQYIGDNTRFLKDSWASIAEFLEFCSGMREQIAAGPLPPETARKFSDLFQRSDFCYLLKEVPHAIDQSLEGLQRVTKIVRGMKEFSHPGTEEKRPININRAIETTITVARHEWKYCADVITAFDETLPLVPCLVGEFNQAVLNLMINAAHAITAAIGDEPRKGTITVGTRRDRNWAEISITDTGTGIAPEIRARIFEPFFTTKAVGKGTGQGLALAHSVIVTRHQGKIWFDTEVDRGTTFFVRLPIDIGVPVT